jgi:hypothetical protein
MIRPQITDRAAMAARLPSELAMYLRAHDWTIQDRAGSSVQWVKTVDGEEFEALQPQESSIRDYAARVGDLVSVLAAAEDRSELEVLGDITSVSMDVHTVRAFPQDNAPGMISLDDGVQAYESLRGLVVAAAYAVGADRPRAVQPARKSAEVLNSCVRCISVRRPKAASSCPCTRRCHRGCPLPRPHSSKPRTPMGWNLPSRSNAASR